MFFYDIAQASELTALFDRFSKASPTYWSLRVLPPVTAVVLDPPRTRTI